MKLELSSHPISHLVTLALAWALGSPVGVEAQNSLHDLLLRDVVVLELEKGELVGRGAEALAIATAEARFVALGEEHNTRAIPAFATSLFRLLQSRNGFQYLALEEGPHLGELLSGAVRSGVPAAVETLGRRYPGAFHMYSIEELGMIDVIGRISTAAHPIWGLNQEFGASHVLDRLVEVAPDEPSRAIAKHLREEALQYETERFVRNAGYLGEVAAPDDFEELRVAFLSDAGSEATRLIGQLQLSASIWAPYYTEPKPTREAFRVSGRARERNMKTLFGLRLREAQGHGDQRPRVLVKSGHYHLYRGRSPRVELHTLGNFLSEVSTYLGGESIHLYTVVDQPWLRKSWLAPLVEVADSLTDRPGEGLLFDLRRMRAWAARSADLDPEVQRLILGYDFFVFLRDGESATVEGLLTENGKWYPE